jgi:hypothetical protein
MDKQFDTTQELNLNEDVLRDLLDNEVMLIGGGDFTVTTY